MAKFENNAKKLKRLDAVLSVYGSNPADWPVGERAALKRVIASVPAAARLLDEAAALGRVMGYASAGLASEDIKQRIVSAAVEDGSTEPRVIPIAVSRSRRSVSFSAERGAMWPAAALAASFAFGLYLGVSGLGTNTVDQALELASLNGVSEELEEVELLPGVIGGDQDSLL